jgi:WD40 repeat protein
MTEGPIPNPLVKEMKIEAGGTGVVAGKIGALHLHVDVQRAATPIDPFATVPPLPPNFIPRPKITEPIITSLFESGTVALTAIEGMGGIGKTVVANEICHDMRIRRTFHDGILWFPVGKQSGCTPENLIRQMAMHLNLEFKVYSPAVYRSLLNGKSILVVLDDVWTLDFIEPFLINNDGSRLLYTTRNRDIAPAVGAKNHDVGVVDELEARRYLARWSGYELTDLPQPDATEIISECKGLVLALAMIGAALKNRPPGGWERIIKNLREADLKNAGTRVTNYAYRTIWASISASVEELSPEDRERYFDLSIMLEEMGASATLLQQLWGGDTEEVETIMNRLVERSLASQDATDGIRLHDLQLDYVRAHFPDREALRLIQGAIKLSTHVITEDPGQFASQVVGRLITHRKVSAIRQFTERVAQCISTPWLRPLYANLDPAGTTLLRIFQTDSAYDSGVALSGSGKIAVSACDKNALKVWDVENGRELQKLQGHTDKIAAIAISGNGSVIASTSFDETLRLWDTNTGRQLRSRSCSASSIALNENGSILAFYENTKLVIWNLENGEEVCSFEGHGERITCVQISADGRRAISSSCDKSIKVWDVFSGAESRTLYGHSEKVYPIAMSANGKLAVSASRDNALRFWNLENGKQIRALTNDPHELVLAISASGDRLVSGSYHCQVLSWDVENGQGPTALGGHDDWITGIAISANGQRAVSTSRDRTIKVWDLRYRSEAPVLLTRHSGFVYSVAANHNGTVVVSAGRDHALAVWDGFDGRVLRTVQGPILHFGVGVALSANGTRAMFVDRLTIKVWNPMDGQILSVLRGHTDEVRGVAITSDGRVGISASEDKTVRLWDLASGRQTQTLLGHTRSVVCVSISSDGKVAISGSDDDTLKVWNVEEGYELRTLRGHIAPPYSVALSEDGKVAVSASHGRSFKIWNVETGIALRDIQGHDDQIRCISLSSDGRKVVTASEDCTVKIWDSENASLIATFTCDSPVRSCTLVGDCDVVAGDDRGCVHFLRLEEPST